MGFAILLGLIAYFFFARAVARAVEKKTVSKRAKYAAIAFFVLIPTWDIIPGWLYFGYLCNAQGGQTIYRTVEVGPQYILEPGELDQSKADAPSAKGGEINWAKLREHYQLVNEEYPRPFNIQIIHYFTKDTNAGDVLGNSISVRYYGGWLIKNFGPFMLPWECPNSPADIDYVHSTLLERIFLTPQINSKTGE